MHINEDLAKLAAFIFARAQVNLVTTNDGLLRVALTTLWHLLALAVADFLDDDLLNDLLGQNACLLVAVAALKRFHRLVIILDQRRRQWLGQFRSITVKRIRLHTQRP